MNPIADELCTWWADEPQLVGGACGRCGATTFPEQPNCPACGDLMEQRLLERRGVLWTFTVQRYPPKSPPYSLAKAQEEFVPYCVGYVELPDGLRVEALLAVPDPEPLRIGMVMELVVIPFTGDTVTYAFRPVEEAQDA